MELTLSASAWWAKFCYTVQRVAWRWWWRGVYSNIWIPPPLESISDPPGPAGGSRAEGTESSNPCLPKFGQHSPISQLIIRPPAGLNRVISMLVCEMPLPVEETSSHIYDTVPGSTLLIIFDTGPLKWLTHSNQLWFVLYY